jgi:hypothetical protein
MAARKNWMTGAWIVFLSILSVKSQSTDCATTLQVFKAMGGSTTLTDGCSLPGVTSSNGIVTSIIWNARGLSGAIPSSIGNLINLQYLSLQQNQLNGTIPSSIANLRNLRTLSFWRNQLSGEIPSSIVNLINLRELYLSSNQFSGAIPASIGNLKTLQYLFCFLISEHSTIKTHLCFVK